MKRAGVAVADQGGRESESVVVVAQLIESYSSVRRTKQTGEGRGRGVAERGQGRAGVGRGRMRSACAWRVFA